jgi:hypothetical protein
MSVTLPFARLRLEALEDRLVPSGDMVIQWNDILRDAVRTASSPPTFASRNMAITQAAVYDAVNALDRTHEVLLIDALAHPKASREAAVAAAAHRALVGLYPTQAATFDAKLAASLATIPDGKAEDDGVALGRSVAEQILALRQNDGSAVVLPPYLGGSAPGEWRPTPPASLPGLHPQWPDVTPFAMTSADQFRPVAPPALGSEAYTAAFNEVKDLGSATSATRTAEQKDIALFWVNGPGTASAPGHLNLLAQIVAQQEGNTLEQNARLFAALNVTIADSILSCWDTKYQFSLWRPVTGIRLAADDDNAATEADPAWTPLIPTPPFPSYTSAHSHVSGAAAAVLAGFFGSDNKSFTLPSQNTALPDRSYTSFSQAAQESANSRLNAGMHWRFDNEVGLDVGNAIGNYVMANFLRPVAREAAAGVVNGELIVVGTDGSDALRVSRSGDALVVWANGQRLGEFALAVSSIVVDARDGNDLILIAHQVQTDAELYGGAGNDLISGGSGHDRIFGEGGCDILLGNFGNDHLDGGDGDDFLFGGLGDDVLIGGLGYDWLFGGPGRNRLFPN